MDAPSTSPLLHAFAFMRDLSQTGQVRLLGGMHAADIAPGSLVLNRGDETSGVYLVTAGALRVFYVTPEGREGTLYRVEPGQSCILALNCTFARVPYPAWVEADMQPTKVVIVPGALWRSLFGTEPAIQAFTFDALAGRLFDLMARLEEATAFSVEQRLACVLLRDADAQGKIYGSQDRLARHLGSAREVISRALRALAARGVVETGSGVVTIRDAPTLTRIALGHGRGP